MGAWGHGLLENDTALDLLGDVGEAAAAGRTAILEARLRAVVENQDYLDGPDVDEALVAAALVLVAAGGDVPASAGDVAGLAEVAGPLPLPGVGLLQMARRALARAADPEDNEWLELWDEAGELDAARGRVRDLAAALANLGEPAAGVDRRLVFAEGASNKFWNISVVGTAVTVHFGRTGTKGQTRTKDYDSPEEARREADKQVAEKVKKGYTDAAPAPAPAVAAIDGVEHFRTSVRALIRPGLVSLDEALESLLEQADDDPDIPLGEVEAEAIVREVWAERVAELADGRRGDDVRVEAAFRALRGAGYVAEMNVGYTMSDAWAELGEQVEGSSAQGLAFFHGQDAERLALSPAELYIGFDCVSGKDADMIAVARAIVYALTAQSLTVEWDGRPGTRIKVVNVDWRKPLPALDAVAPTEQVKKGVFRRFRS